MRLISLPFRLSGGAVATVDQASEAAVQEKLADQLLTRRGERTIVPMYGTLDPAFTQFDPSDVQLAVDLFGPRVNIEDVEVEYPSDGVQEATIRYAES